MIVPPNFDQFHPHFELHQSGLKLWLSISASLSTLFTSVWFYLLLYFSVSACLSLSLTTATLSGYLQCLSTSLPMCLHLFTHLRRHLFFCLFFSQFYQLLKEFDPVTMNLLCINTCKKNIKTRLTESHLQLYSSNFQTNSGSLKNLLSLFQVQHSTFINVDIFLLLLPCMSVYQSFNWKEKTQSFMYTFCRE